MEFITKEDTNLFLKNFESGIYDNRGIIDRYIINFILRCVKSNYDDETASMIVSNIIRNRIRNRFDLCDENVLHNAYGDLLFIDESINMHLNINIASDDKIDDEFMENYFTSLYNCADIVKTYFMSNKSVDADDELNRIFNKQSLDLRDLDRETFLSSCFRKKVLEETKIVKKNIKKNVYKNAIAS